MYIQSYQIHNVLNVYRKQLSAGNDAKKGEAPQTAPKGDTVELTARFHRQSLIDQVSAEIVDRIAQGGSQKRFEDAIASEWQRTAVAGKKRGDRREAAFTYSVIDENDRKTTNTLPVENFSPLTGREALKSREEDE